MFFSHARIAIATAFATCAVGAIAFGPSLAATAPDAAQHVTPNEGFSRSLGSKQAVGFYERIAGRCAITLMVAEAFDEAASGAPPSAARVRVMLDPVQSLDLASAESQSLSITCGPGADTASIAVKSLAGM